MVFKVLFCSKIEWEHIQKEKKKKRKENITHIIHIKTFEEYYLVGVLLHQLVEEEYVFQ